MSLMSLMKLELFFDYEILDCIYHLAHKDARCYGYSKVEIDSVEFFLYSNNEINLVY